jgi:DNA-binding CsgD family transcriptional regulator
VLGFIVLVRSFLVGSLLEGLPKETILHVYHLFAFLEFPFIVLSIYLFYCFIRGLLEKDVSSLFNMIYSIFWGILFILQVLLLKNYYDTKDDNLLNTFHIWVSYLILIFFFSLISYLIYGAKDSPSVKRELRIFGLLYLICFVIASIGLTDHILVLFGPFIVIVAVLLYISINFPPLLYIKFYMKKHPFKPQIQAFDEADLKRFFSKHEISKREQEIILLLLKGKSNTDIEKDLYISLNTVKNHIYNIYQKLGVKNRLQLNRLIQDYLQSNPTQIKTA